MLNHEGLFIAECVNLGFDVVFLILFTYRFCNLRSYSRTDRYKSTPIPTQTTSPKCAYFSPSSTSD